MLKASKLELMSLLIIMALNTNAKNTNCKNRPLKIHVTEKYLSAQISESGTATVFLKRFFKWYKTEYDYLDHHIYPIQMDLKKHTPYRINFTETERYLSIFKSSGFFTDNYINYYRAYYKKIDLRLQKTKQNDGTVDELDHDFVIKSQEPESVMENLNIIRLTLIKSIQNDTIVKMQTQYDQGTYSLFHLKMINGKYLIDKIDFINGDKIEN